MSTATEISAAPGERFERAAVPTALIGMAIFVAAEVMFFSGLMSAFTVLRAGRPWPPLGQPVLPAGTTAVNTLFLIASAACLQLGVSKARAEGSRAAFGFLAAASGLGAIFLAAQGLEWVRLVGFGLTLTSSVYGAAFYTLIGTHALHVLGGLIGLLVTTSRAGAGKYGPENLTGLNVCRFYWFFVTGIWPILYGLVYF